MYVRGHILAIGVSLLLTLSPALAESQFTYLLKPSCDGTGTGVTGGNLSSKIEVPDSTVSSDGMITAPQTQSKVCAAVIEEAYSAFALLWSQRISLTTIASSSVKCNIEVSARQSGNVSIPQQPVTMNCSGTKVFADGLANR